MEIDITTFAILTIIGLVSGVLGTFFAPWVRWGFDKKMLIRQERKETLSQCREVLSKDISAKEFSMHPIYSKIKPYLSSAAIIAVEGSGKFDGEEIRVVKGNGRHCGVNPFKQRILDEIAHQERVWELI